MASVQQCLRCGEFGHMQLSCPNEDNVEARKALNELSRVQRSQSKNEEYRRKWDLRKQSLDNFNVSTQTLRITTSIKNLIAM